MAERCPTCGELRPDPSGPVDYLRITSAILCVYACKKGGNVAAAATAFAATFRVSPRRALFALEQLADALGTDLEPWSNDDDND